MNNRHGWYKKLQSKAVCEFAIATAATRYPPLLARDSDALHYELPDPEQPLEQAIRVVAEVLVRIILPPPVVVLLPPIPHPMPIVLRTCPRIVTRLLLLRTLPPSLPRLR